MGSIRNTVYYCSVWNGGKVLYSFNSEGDHEIENLAALCLEKAPSHHKWYFQTMFKKTFGFLMEDGYVYFAIIDSTLGNPANLDFLQHLRDEFKKVTKKGSNRSFTNLNSIVLQEQLVPIIRQLIASLEHVTESTPTPSPYNDGLSPSDNNGNLDNGISTKAPLLGKSSKQEKRKMREHVITVRENGVAEDHRKSADKGGTKTDLTNLDSNNNQGGSMTGVSLTKEVSSMNRSSTQTVRNKWCRQVRIVLAIDVVVCLILFVVWIVVCRGTECIR